MNSLTPLALTIAFVALACGESRPTPEVAVTTASSPPPEASTAAPIRSAAPQPSATYAPPVASSAPEVTEAPRTPPTDAAQKAADGALARIAKVTPGTLGKPEERCVSGICEWHWPVIGQQG